MTKPQTFTNYLDTTELAPATRAAYIRFVQEYQALTPNHITAARTHITQYLAHLRSRGLAHPTRAARLAALKAYYNYLAHTGQRDDHPCRNLTLRGPPRAERIDPSQLYTQQQLNQLLNECRTKAVTDNADADDGQPLLRLILCGLLCHQALAPAEICAITTQHIDLENGTLRAPGTNTSNPRTLPLHAAQALHLNRYLNHLRPKRAQNASPKTNALLLSAIGRPLLRQKLPNILNHGRNRKRWLMPRRIRQSVISHLLGNGHDVSIVQAFAGHRYPSTTLRYSPTQLAELNDVIQRLHPLQ